MKCQFSGCEEPATEEICCTVCGHDGDSLEHICLCKHHKDLLLNSETAVSVEIRSFTGGFIE